MSLGLLGAGLLGEREERAMYIRLGRLTVDWRRGWCLTLVWRASREECSSVCFRGGQVHVTLVRLGA